MTKRNRVDEMGARIIEAAGSRAFMTMWLNGERDGKVFTR